MYLQFLWMIVLELTIFYIPSVGRCRGFSITSKIIIKNPPRGADKYPNPMKKIRVFELNIEFSIFARTQKNECVPCWCFFFLNYWPKNSSSDLHIYKWVVNLRLFGCLGGVWRTRMYRLVSCLRRKLQMHKFTLPCWIE